MMSAETVMEFRLAQPQACSHALLGTQLGRIPSSCQAFAGTACLHRSMRQGLPWTSMTSSRRQPVAQAGQPAVSLVITSSSSSSLAALHVIIVGRPSTMEFRAKKAACVVKTMPPMSRCGSLHSSPVQTSDRCRNSDD